jgi:UDP-2,4-diacetamido-2,4,6-trideoxy-beta-L-altropyranose hydrolase
MKIVKVVFRVDGSLTIGMGHLIRCLALALMLKDEYDITFFCIEVPESVEKDIINSGFEVVKIENEENFLELINKLHIVVLDHYGLGTDYQKKIKAIGCKLVCIDDLHDKEFFADLIINHAPGISEEDYIAQSYTQFALGLDCVLLRPAFLEQAKKPRVIEKINTVFICFGGADFKNLTQKVLKIVCEFNNFERIIVVTGVAYSFDKQLNEFILSQSNIERYHNVGELQMLKLMSQSDLLIVPASGILLEAFATSAIVISGMYIDNQKYAFEEFKRQNLIISAEDFSVKAIKNALIKVVNFPKHEKSVDGKQKERMLKKFNSLLD